MLSLVTFYTYTKSYLTQVFLRGHAGTREIVYIFFKPSGPTGFEPVTPRFVAESSIQAEVKAQKLKEQGYYSV